MSSSKYMQKAWHIGVVDSHCHPTDIMSAIGEFDKMHAKVLTVMSTRSQDQELVYETAKKYPLTSKDELDQQNDARYVVPAFGWHPWFSHQMVDDRVQENLPTADEHYRKVLDPPPTDSKFADSLPEPRSLKQFLVDTEKRLLEFPFALVGEVGLDRAFRVPIPAKSKDHSNQDGYTAGSRGGQPLSPHHVHIDHQKLILKAQLQLAAKHRRAVSLHSVATHGVIFDTLSELWKGHEKPSKGAIKRQKKDAEARNLEDSHVEDVAQMTPFPPRLCMHSYSGPPEALKQFLAQKVPAEIFFSFSELINFGNRPSNKAAECIRMVPDDKIVIESDLHTAGKQMDDLLAQILTHVCEIKGWSIEEGARILRDNWMRFVFGPERTD